MPFNRNEYEYIRYRMNNACKQYLITHGLLHGKLSQEEMQEKIKEYKTEYALRKKRLAEKKAYQEALRRHKFIYG